MLNSRDIHLLTKAAQEKCVRWRAQCAAIGLQIKITSTLRDLEFQRELYAQGRTKPGKKVTWCKPEESKHLPYGDEHKSIAWDFVLVGPDTHLVWDIKADINQDNKKDYEEVAELARQLGLKAGADFGDYCHIQLDV